MAVWVVGVYVINRVRKDPRWSVSMPGSSAGRRHRRQDHPKSPHPFASLSTLQVAGIFAAACAVTLVAGVGLELTGNTLADRAGINGVIFGATVLAAATALPEISSGIAAVRLGDNALAIGDIFGGNAFQVCLFLLADLIAGSPVLPTAGRLNSWLASLGVALTAVYAIGVVGRPYRCIARLGPTRSSRSSSSRSASPGCSSYRTEGEGSAEHNKNKVEIFSRSVENLVAQLTHLPGVGTRTAQRLAFHLLRTSKDEALALAGAIGEVKERVRFCPECGNLTEEELCEICRDARRDRSLVCVVEQPVDLISVERTHEYRGLYHVLGGALSPLDGVEPEHLRIDELMSRVDANGVEEVVLATNPNMTGEATAAYLADRLRGRVRVTRLASGLPVGGDLEYADEVTLGRALSGRREM